jgi:hypothetical protein
MAIQTLTSFKFANWGAKATPIPETKKPVDLCAPVPEDERVVHIDDRNMDMIERRSEEIIKKIDSISTLKLDKKITKEFMPKPVTTTFSKCIFPVTIQRPEKEEHQINIMADYDARYFSMPSAGYDAILDMYVIDEGQHRLLALRDRIRLGLQPDCKPDDWEDYPIHLQVINLEINEDENGNLYCDYSPLRVRFLIENDRKLAVSEFDKFKNEVHGKLTDSPNSQTLPEYERAAEIYLKLKQRNITPVDSSDHGQRSKAGALSAVRYLRDKKFTMSDVDNMANFHHEFTAHEPVSDMQVLPVKWLYKLNTAHHWYDQNDPDKVSEFKQFLFCLNATCAVKNDFDLWMSFAREVWKRRMKKLKAHDNIPADFSMVLLIQLTAKAGYTYPGIDPDWYNAYTTPISSWDVLTQAEKNLFV